MFRLNKAALAVLLEISVLDPVLVIESCSTDWIPRVLVSPGINNFQICGLVCRVLSGWLDDPKIREKAELQLVLEVSIQKSEFQEDVFLANFCATSRSWIFQSNRPKTKKFT